MTGCMAVRKLLKEIKKYVRPGAAVVAACSGGADSVALTDALWQLSGECGYKIYVMHVEHGLRGEEALADAEFTRLFCEKRSLPFVCRHVNAGAYARENGLSVEDAARRLRYRELWQFVEETGADYLLTAHQLDDQAETVLMQLLRGSGMAGLGGMKVCSGRHLRPLLFLQRSDIEAYCRNRSLPYCSDSTNEDLHYTRNRIRKKLLPYLETFNPRVKKALAQTALLAQSDNELAESMAERFFKDYVSAQDAMQCCPAQPLNDAPDAVAMRVIRKMWQQVSRSGELGLGHVQSVRQLAANNGSGKFVMLPGAAAAYSYGRIYIGTLPEIKKLICAAEFAAAEICLRVSDIINGGRKVNLGGGRSLFLSIEEACPEITPRQAAYPLELIGEEIAVRTRRNGDRFYPYGSGGTKKLKDFFIDSKIARAERDRKLLVADGSNILWIIGERQAGWKIKPSGKWLVMRLAQGKDENND